MGASRMQFSILCVAPLALTLLSGAGIRAATLSAPQGKIRFEAEAGARSSESISVRVNGEWRKALTADGAAARLVVAGHPDQAKSCTISSLSSIPDGLLLVGDCGAGTFEERVVLSSEPDVLDVSMRFRPKAGIEIRSLEDRYNFAPGRRDTDTPTLGPVDLVWSQNIKNQQDGDISVWGFKSPVIMLQQGPVFAALLPRLSDHRRLPLALDLDVTSGPLPWLSYGQIPSQPYGHSYFRRSSTETVSGLAGFLTYSYRIAASELPSRLGYRRAVRLLWAETGHPELMRSNNLQQNVIRSELVTFDQWREDTWVRYANEVYRGFDCGGRRCGTLVSDRNPWGRWNQGAPDAWFNAWFQTLRSAYGWYQYGQRAKNPEIEQKAESVLNLALSSPQNQGVFPTIYLLNDKRWIRDDGWAGFPDDYHTFDMSWTAYWMLQWAGLVPSRKEEILAYVRPYGDFLVQHQLASGVIPSWYDAELKPVETFRDFNAETAGSALLLATLYQSTHNRRYLESAERAMEFIQREVLPRQRWFDFETFFSCARKPLGFYDHWTAQYPQNNLSQIQAAKAYLALFDATGDRHYLEQGEQVLDYLLLTQQVWNNPAFSPRLVGGFTTQNTDAEWSDAREAYAAIVLWNYYEASGRQEYLERAIAAARSTFAVAPWENWAHTGFRDIPGSLTGFHWGPGSGMTSVEIMSSTLGDAFVDFQRRTGAGFNASSLQHLHPSSGSISLALAAFPGHRGLLLRFSGLDPDSQYRVAVNGDALAPTDGGTLMRQGYSIVLPQP